MQNNFDKGEYTMVQNDYERAYKIKKRIRELQQLSDAGYAVSRKELHGLQSEYEKLKKQFDIIADDLSCEMNVLLERRFFEAWSYRMIKKHLNLYGTDPRIAIETYFAVEKRNRRRKRSH